MTAPERIWVDVTWTGQDGGQKEGSWANHTKNGTEYVRADRIEQLEDERDRYKFALENIRDINPSVTTLMADGTWREAHRDLQRIARAALSTQEDG